jgi:hypothetical protein
LEPRPLNLTNQLPNFAVQLGRLPLSLPGHAHLTKRYKAASLLRRVERIANLADAISLAFGTLD